MSTDVAMAVDLPQDQESVYSSSPSVCSVRSSEASSPVANSATSTSSSASFPSRQYSPFSSPQRSLLSANKMLYDMAPTNSQFIPFLPKSLSVGSSFLQQSSSSDCIMLMQPDELASGGSLTCTLVNILRGLRLLDKCGLEELSISLYDSVECQEQSSDTTKLACSDKSDSVNRSSSSPFSSSSLQRRSTLPTDKVYSNRVEVTRGSDATTSTESRTGRLVSYLLTCSRHGGCPFATGFHFPRPNSLCKAYSVTSDTIPEASGETAATSTATATLEFVMSRVRSATVSLDWRRGRADGLVRLLTIPHDTNVSSMLHAGPPMARLVAGRYLVGRNGWKTISPPAVAWTSQTLLGLDVEANDFLSWLAAWLQCGAVLVLAHLQTPPAASVGYSNYESSSCNAPTELSWRHRLIFGVTSYGLVLLSNPVEQVSLHYLLKQLSIQTVIRVAKSDLFRLWCSYPSSADFTSVEGGGGGGGDGGETRSKWTIVSTSTSLSDGNVSILGYQADPRWQSMNILGQLICTLRDFDEFWESKQRVISQQSAASSRSSHERGGENGSAAHPFGMLVSPYIVIPCAQSPGISIFVPKAHKSLLAALFTSTVFVAR